MSWEYYIDELENPSRTPEEVVADIIKRLGLDTKNRLRENTYRRQYLMWFMEQKTCRTLQYIGKMFNRDHSTVLHAIRQVDFFIDTKDALFLEITEDVRSEVEAYEFDSVFKEERKKVIMLSAVVPFKLYTKLSRYKDEKGLTISDVIRRGIEEQIEKSLSM